MHVGFALTLDSPSLPSPMQRNWQLHKVALFRSHGMLDVQAHMLPSIAPTAEVDNCREATMLILLMMMESSLMEAALVSLLSSSIRDVLWATSRVWLHHRHANNAILEFFLECYKRYQSAHTKTFLVSGLWRIQDSTSEPDWMSLVDWLRISTSPLHLIRFSLNWSWRAPLSFVFKMPLTIYFFGSGLASICCHSGDILCFSRAIHKLVRF